MPFQTGGAGVTTLSDLEIDTDKDWKAHSIYSLGDLTPKADKAYNLGGPNTQFDTAYAGLVDNIVTSPKLASDAIYKHHLRVGIVDTSYLTDDAATSAKVGPSVDLEFVRSNDNTVAGDISAAADGAYNLGSPSAKFDNAYASNVPPLVTEPVSNAAGDLDSVRDVSSGALSLQNLLAATDGADVVNDANLTTSKAADIAYQSELQPVKFADVFDHSNLGSDKATDIVYHGNFNLPSAEARDKVVASTYGMAADQTGVKGLSKQVTEKKDFAFRTETPNHAYWHRMYNTPAAFETVYQDYTTSMQKKGTTPDKSAPNTADPNPQPGACWSVSMVPDGTAVGGFASPASNPHDAGWTGQYLWHADYGADYIYKLKPDGTQTGGGFATPMIEPRGAAWDGQYVWSTYDAGHVYQLDQAGGTVAHWLSPGPRPIGCGWDGEYIWMGDITANCVYKCLPDGTLKATPVTIMLTGFGYDGQYLWAGQNTSGTVYQFLPDGTQIGTFGAPGPGPKGGPWDGQYLWLPDDTADYIYRTGNAGNLDVNYRIFAK